MTTLQNWLRRVAPLIAVLLCLGACASVDGGPGGSNTGRSDYSDRPDKVGTGGGGGGGY